MTLLLTLLYVTAAALEGAALMLFLLDVKAESKARATLLDVQSQLDVRDRLDPLYTRTGIAPAEYQYMREAVVLLLGTPRRRTIGLALLVGGVAFGTGANLVALFT